MYNCLPEICLGLKSRGIDFGHVQRWWQLYGIILCSCIDTLQSLNKRQTKAKLLLVLFSDDDNNLQVLLLNWNKTNKCRFKWLLLSFIWTNGHNTDGLCAIVFLYFIPHSMIAQQYYYLNRDAKIHPLFPDRSTLCIKPCQRKTTRVPTTISFRQYSIACVLISLIQWIQNKM